MSLTTDSERSDHDPSTAGLLSPLYGIATFASLSPSATNAPLPGSASSSTRLSYPSRSVTPSSSDDGSRLRRVAISPTVSSYDSRRHTDSEVYSDDNDNSIDDTAEVEETLSLIDDDDLQASRDNWNSGYSSVSATTRSATGSYATATTEPLNFDRERRSLSTISERTESQSLNSGVGAGSSILQNLFSSTFSRPGSFISAAARSLYGAPASPLAPPSAITAGTRPATPERTFKPAPPTGRRVGDLVATFESDISNSRPGSVPLGPRSPSPFNGSSRSTSPTKSSHSRAYTDGSYSYSGSYTHSRSYTEGSIASPTNGHPHPASFSSHLSPPPPTSALSRSTLGSSETERPRSPLSSVRNIVAAWRERSPEKASTAASSTSRSTASPSEQGAATSTISPSESASAAGVTRRVPASTFYTLSEPTFTQLSTETSSSSEGTEVVPSSLSLRGSSSASLLGDSHEGPPTSEDSQRVRSPISPSTPTRTLGTLYSSTNGLSRASAVRRRTPRSARSYSRSTSSTSAPITSTTSDKENEITETEPSQWSSLQGSYTSTSIEYEYTRTPRTPSEPSITLSPRQERVRGMPPKAEPESDEDVFVTPTASRSATSYHSVPSAPGTPTPSSTSVPTSEFDTAIKPPSTEYVTAEICPSEPPATEYMTAEICPSEAPATEYVTAEVCPSTPPATEYFTAECVCKPQPPTIPEQISSLTRSLSLTSVSEEKPEEETVSLYAPTIPSLIEEAKIPLPESEEELVSPLSESIKLSPSPVPTPVIETPTPSSVTETSVETTTSITPSTVSSIPPPSSPSSPSIVSIPESPSSPSSPTTVEYRSEPSRTPKSRTLYVPSQSSPKSTSPSVSDYESSLFAPSPSVQSVPIQEQADISFETSFMRPGASEMLSEQSPSPFMPKGIEVSGLSSTETPSSTSVGTTSSISPTTVTRIQESPEASTPSSVSTTSSLSATQVSTLTPSTALLSVPPARSPRRTPTPSSLTPSSYIEGSTVASSVPYTEVSSVTPSSSIPRGPFEDESVLGRMVTVTRTPSSVSSISTASMDSAIFAPTVYEEAIESPPTVPTLLSSRAATPRPITPREVPLPSSPSVSIATAMPSISTPRSDARTLTSVMTTDIVEAPREEILTHDVNRLLRYLHDLDQIRGGETQDIKDHLGRIEDELRNLSDSLRRPTAPLKDRSVGSSVPVSRTVPSEHVSPPAGPAVIPQGPSVTSVSTPPLPVPAPREVHTPTARGAPTPVPTSVPTPVPTLAPLQPEISFSYSPSTISRDLSILESPHSEDLSLMSLQDYPAVPISPPGSPSSPSSFGSGWPPSSTDAPPPPSSVTPSSETQSSMIRGVESVSDLTPESPFVRTTPVPVPSPLASLATPESALPLPPQSSTPSQELRDVRVSPMPAGPYAGSPLPTPSPLEPTSERSSLSLATPPPSSSMPSSVPSSTPPSGAREGPPAPEIRHPASPVLSISEAEPPSPGPAGSAVLSETPRAEIREGPPAFPVEGPTMPSPEPFVPVPSPPISIPTARPSPGPPSRALDDLRDLLEDLRGQAQALWNGQLSTNRMLDDLIARGPPTAPATAVDNEEIRNRLRNIEGLLDGILRDLERGFPPEEPVSEISSDTSSALRRYIDRLRERRQEAPGLQIPTPMRAPPPILDPEWLEFISEPPPVAEQPIQGPPPLVPLHRRAPRRRRELSVSPPISIELPQRALSAPPSTPSMPVYDTWQPWRYPPQRRPRPRPEPLYRPERFEGEPTSELLDRPPGRPPPSRSPVGRRTPVDSGADIDMLDAIHRLRRQRRPGGDGRIDATRPLHPEESPPWVEVPPPPRPTTAPPTTAPWIPTQPQVRPSQTVGDIGAVPAPPAPPPQPVQTAPGVPQPMMPMLGVPTGLRPPYDEMLHLLRQNRLAQTASIDQQREIMRYMRALNQWLENDVRDRHREMRSIADRVDQLRALLQGMGISPPGPPAFQMPQAMPGQAPAGQTYVVPPFPPPVPVGFPPGVMPAPVMPVGGGPPVVPPEISPSPTFIPPHPPMEQPPVVPTGIYPYPPPGLAPRLGSPVEIEPRPEVAPYIPPRPTSMIPVPPPGIPGVPPVVVAPPVPVEPSESLLSRTPSSSPPRSPSRPPSIHVHVPSAPSQVPPEVVRVEEPPAGPRHPAVSDIYGRPPTAIPQQPSQPPILIAPPQPPPPTFPSGFPGEQPPIVVRPESRERHEPSVVVVRPSRTPSPTRVMVPPSRRSRAESSPHERRPPRSIHQRPSYEEDRGRSYSRTPSPHIIVQQPPSVQPPIGVPPPFAPMPPVIAVPPPRSPTRPRSRTPSRSPPPVVIQQPPLVPGEPPYPPAQPVLIQPQPTQGPSQPTVLVPPPGPPSRPYEERRSPSPTYVPAVPSQPVVVQMPPEVRRRTPSPRRSITPRDEGRPERLHRRPRSPTPERERHPSRYREEEEPHRVRRSPSLMYPDRPHVHRPGYVPSRPVSPPVTAVPITPSGRRPSVEREYERPESPTRVVVHRPPTRSPRLPSLERRTVMAPPPTAPTYERPESPYGPPTQVIAIPTARPEPVPARVERSPTLVPVPEYPPSEARPIRPPVPVAAPPSRRIPSEPVYEHDVGVPHVTRRPSPSGPGDLSFQEALEARDERLDEQERRLEEMNREAADAEERREQYFREHEEERDRLFRENKERRFREVDEAREEYEHLREDAEHIRDELERSLEEIPRPAAGLPVTGQPPVEGVEAAIPVSEAAPVSERESIPESVRPVPPPVPPSVPPVAAEGLPQLQEILDLLLAQQTENAQCKAEQQERFDILRDEIDQARADAKEECEERIRLLEDELARAREELEREREQRRAEDLERIEREHADVIERDEATRAQLGDITNLIQEQHEELARKKELMDERWAEKQRRREDKQGRTSAMHEMLERILQEREQERRERETEREAAAQRPNIETVLDELRRQNEQQIQLINNLTDAWRADSARQHEDTINAVRATAQEMVPYNLTGYLDEFSKSLAGEIRTLLGEVGRLHEQKRTLQFEIGSLLHMYSQYGPGGQFEPDWHPTMGPLAPPHIPGGGGEPPGGPGGPPPPGPEEPPPPARPAWRTVQQRAPRRRRTAKTEAPQPQQQAPGATLAPPEPIPHPPSWATWQPNPAFVPSPPPPGSSPLVVPPSGPTGLFGPRSPRGTMYGS